MAYRYPRRYVSFADLAVEMIADKGYAGVPNRSFLCLKKIADGIMRKNNINAALTETEIDRNKSISKNDTLLSSILGSQRCLMTSGAQGSPPSSKTVSMPSMFRQFAFNLRKGACILKRLPA